MRGWDIPPICKASRPDHRLRIQDTCNITEKGKRGRHDGKRKTCEESREGRLSSGSRKN
jgi:hypothetical protein